jgi:hypothetical protein
MYTHAAKVWDLSIVQGPLSPRKPNVTIRNYFLPIRSLRSAAACCNDAPMPCTSDDIIYAQAVPKAGKQRELSSTWKLLESYRGAMEAVFAAKQGGTGAPLENTESPLDAAVLAALESAG